MSSAIASRMMLALAWSGVASDRDDLQMNTTTSALSAAGKALGALATQLEGAAGAADQQLVAEAAAAKAAAAKAAAAKAAAAKPKT
jgi:hypothetical protein